MISYQASTVAKADPEAVWAAWTDVPGWSDADHIESAELEGEFLPGTTIVSKAGGLPRTTLTITRVERPRLWVDESRSPGVSMTFEHVIEPGDAGTVLTERVLIRGPLAWLVGPLMRRKLQALFGTSVAHVARRADALESRAEPGATKSPPD